MTATLETAGSQSAIQAAKAKLQKDHGCECSCYRPANSTEWHIRVHAPESAAKVVERLLRKIGPVRKGEPSAAAVDAMAKREADLAEQEAALTKREADLAKQEAALAKRDEAKAAPEDSGKGKK